MKKEIKSIAMRCSEEQFEAIKPKLEKANIDILDGSLNNTAIYLINNYDEEILPSIGFYWPHEKTEVVCEQWNEKIFLEACGIEVEPEYKITKEQILELKELALNCKTESIVEKLKKLFPDGSEALKNEAVKRYKIGDYFKCVGSGRIRKFDDSEIVFSDDLDCGLWLRGSEKGEWLMMGGKWAEIIPTITKSDAEKKLNCKIIC